MVPLDIRLASFIIKDYTTRIKINEATIKTLREITALYDCGIIGMEEYIDLGMELWMNL